MRRLTIIEHISLDGVNQVFSEDTTSSTATVPGWEGGAA